MLQLVNLSNYSSDEELIQHSGDWLTNFLVAHHLDGLEMMFCADWNRKIYKPAYLQGAHLRFWPSWLDFWRGDQAELVRQFGSVENITACYGGVERDAWLELYRENIRIAVASGVQYLVFHVGNVRTDELFSWHFSATDRDVVEATIEVVNELAAEIPEDRLLLFENLWWPGLTLQDAKLVALLLEKVKHNNSGIMLDTGHLMNTNQNLKTEAEGIQYILTVLDRLGSWQKSIRGIHLHQSLSGDYVKQSREQAPADYTMTDVMTHVLKIDQHQPFTCSAVSKIIEQVQPDFLVHEFMQLSRTDWAQKVQLQQQTLQMAVRETARSLAGGAL
jgi:hypothetical protein